MSEMMTPKQTAEQLLETVLRGFEDLSNQRRAVAADLSQGDEISRATARGEAGAYYAVVVTVRSRMVDLAGVSEAEQYRAQLAEIGRLIFAVGRGDQHAIQRYFEILAPFLPPDELAKLDPRMTQSQPGATLQ